MSCIHVVTVMSTLCPVLIHTLQLYSCEYSKIPFLHFCGDHLKWRKIQGSVILGNIVLMGKPSRTMYRTI